MSASMPSSEQFPRVRSADTVLAVRLAKELCWPAPWEDEAAWELAARARMDRLDTLSAQQSRGDE